jgi:hypothetical protein
MNSALAGGRELGRDVRQVATLGISHGSEPFAR